MVVTSNAGNGGLVLLPIAVLGGRVRALSGAASINVNDAVGDSNAGLILAARLALAPEEFLALSREARLALGDRCRYEPIAETAGKQSRHQRAAWLGRPPPFCPSIG